MHCLQPAIFQIVNINHKRKMQIFDANLRQQREKCLLILFTNLIYMALNVLARNLIVRSNMHRLIISKC